jgi:SAM-dependent methyltransferase
MGAITRVLRRVLRPAKRLSPVLQAYSWYLARKTHREQELLAESTERVVQRWGQVARVRAAVPATDAPASWLDAPLVQQVLIRPRFGGGDWLSFFRQRYLTQPAERGLSLCCGDGYLERGLQDMKICRRVDGIDASPAAVQVAQERAERDGRTGLRYWVADANQVKLESRSYGVVVAAMGLHHVRRLKHLLKEVRKSLEPGGFLVVNEYIGPSRFQWTDDQLRLINDMLGMLPQRLRVQLGDGAVKHEVLRPTVEEMIRIDPSEAVCSVAISRLIARYFDVDTRVDYGGTILYQLLERIVHNFDPAREEDVALLRLLSLLENEAIRAGTLSSDFAVFIAHRR